jgi:hypothetical protein
MDILNFISWIKGGRIVNTVTPSKTLLPIGVKDNKRDDGYIACAISVEDLVTQLTPTPTYKVFTALLTQSGGSQINSQTQGANITQGVTYLIIANSENADLTVFGAPNSNVGTYFVCTTSGTLPMQGTIELQYNTGAPVATVLENTIGNVYWIYVSEGIYVGFVPNIAEQKQVVFSPTSAYKTNSYDSYVRISNNSIDGQVEISTTDGTMGINDTIVDFPIEIRVYN